MLDKETGYVQPEPEEDVQLTGGPGTKLYDWMSSLGIPHCSRCKKTAKWMDELGPLDCRKNIKEIVSQMMDNAKHNPAMLAQIGTMFPSFMQRAALQHVVLHYGIRAYEAEVKS